MTDLAENAELAEAMGWVQALVDGHRAHNGRDEPLGLALLSAGITLLLPMWGVRALAMGAEHMVIENALAISTAGGRA